MGLGFLTLRAFNRAMCWCDEFSGQTIADDLISSIYQEQEKQVDAGCRRDEQMSSISAGSGFRDPQLSVFKRFSQKRFLCFKRLFIYVLKRFRFWKWL
jgi:hypothetical protein